MLQGEGEEQQTTTQTAPQSGMATSQPGMVTSQSGMATSQPGMVTTQPGMMSAQPGMMSSQPGMMTAQPGMMTGMMGGAGMMNGQPGGMMGGSMMNQQLALYNPHQHRPPFMNQGPYGQQVTLSYTHTTHRVYFRGAGGLLPLPPSGIG